MGIFAILVAAGLLLIKSEPAGANIVIEGVSCGETPRLITNLSTAYPHKVVLRKAGFRSTEFKVRFDGRTPVLVNERLVLDSGVLNINTDPEGATLIVNGVDRGVTPCRDITGIPTGRTTVKIRKEGYRDLMESITVKAGDVQTLNYTLEALPGTLALSSVPSGARFYIDDVPKGKGPLVLAGMNPGDYSVRAELEGFAPLTKTVTIGKGGSRSEEFVLSGNMGRLEVRTSPSGAQIIFDGRNLGVTSSNDENAEFSNAFHITNVASGEHTLLVRKDGYGEEIRHPKIRTGKTSTARVRMKRVFEPNVEIETANGVYRGILVSNANDYMSIEVSLGIVRSFPRADIKKINYLTK